MTSATPPYVILRSNATKDLQKQYSRKQNHAFTPAYLASARSAARGDRKESAPLPSASPPPSPQGEGKTFIIPNKYAKRGKTTLLPLFPYKYTDGGECGAHKKRACPENKQGSRKSQRSEIFGKEERQAQRTRRQAKRAVCHGALTRRAAEGRNRCRAAKGGEQQVSPLTKPKQRDPDRKRVSHHICCVKALGNMSLYYLRALPCICGNLPACDCFAP